MKNTGLAARSSGVLAHITSLPSPFGIGDLGPEARDFISYLKTAKQRIWQILPLGPTDPAFSHSPYMSASAMAGNPLLISPQDLLAEGLIHASDIPSITLSPFTVDFKAVSIIKNQILRKAFARFDKSDSSFIEFKESSEHIRNFALFISLKKHSGNKAWFQWEQKTARHDRQIIEKLRKDLEDEINYVLFEQFLFSHQWKKLHSFAKNNNIRIFGDIPIYVSHDSVDVWTNQDIFRLQHDGTPSHVAGVPPDYFSKTGQKWGNPLYRWNDDNPDIRGKLVSWWAERFKSIFSLVDIARIDHFRGFESYWSVPAEEKTAENGIWEQGPGYSFFSEIFNRLGPLDIIAEDLGEITEAVIQLRDRLNFPGMRILQFAFDGNLNNTFLPFNYETTNTVVYTGTHDNNTSVGWYLSNEMDDSARRLIKAYANRSIHDDSSIHSDLIYLALSSIANTAIIPLQDILGFGGDCRMNTPGTASGNWIWRCSKDFLNENTALWLAELTERFGR